MIKNLNKLKKELTELAPLINSFKSEAVQLRIVELIFQEGAEPEKKTRGKTDGKAKAAKAAEAAPARKTRATAAAARTAAPAKKAKRAKSGPTAVLNQLIDEGFFKKPQAIGQIIEYAKAAKNRVIQSNQLSPVLARYVRIGKLKRQKNPKGQYEYTQP